MTQATVIHVPLGQLSVDAVNVRKHGRGAEPAFTASIRDKGVIEPLIVRKNGKGYTVTNGSKRFDALVWLRDKKETSQGTAVTTEFPVPVIVRDETDEEARDTSLITNIVRAGMHPADRYEAFAQLQAGGMTPAAIGLRYALKEKEVKQVLALGRLAPPIREAWRKGDIEDEDVSAFTLEPDHDRQAEIFKSLKKRSGLHSYAIRRAIVGEQDDRDRLLKYVGIDAYVKAGGTVVEDLFTRDDDKESGAIPTDDKLLRKLADEKFAARVEAIKKEGWAWVDTADNLGQNATHWDYERGGKDKVSAKRRAETGVLLRFDFNGNLVTHYGVVKPSQKKAAEKKKARAEGKPTSEISGAMAHRLSVMLTASAAKALPTAPDLAFAVAIAALMTNEYGGSAVQLKANGMLSHERIDADADFTLLLKQVLKKTPKERMDMFASIVGGALDFQGHSAAALPYGPGVDDLDDDKTAVAVCDLIPAKAMNAELKKAFAHEAKDYFGGVSKELIWQAVHDSMGQDHAAKVAQMKKGEAVTFAVANVVKTGWLPPELRTANYDGPAGSKKASAPKAKAKKKA